MNIAAYDLVSRSGFNIVNQNDGKNIWSPVMPCPTIPEASHYDWMAYPITFPMAFDKIRQHQRGSGGGGGGGGGSGQQQSWIYIILSTASSPLSHPSRLAYSFWSDRSNGWSVDVWTGEIYKNNDPPAEVSNSTEGLLSAFSACSLEDDDNDEYGSRNGAFTPMQSSSSAETEGDVPIGTS